ncbi:MAG TPA: response regulator [Verrucomicrobiae bacterium]|jgi:DNA-binding response OmpR family regulator|nr:response regulator [Verrucomicrobiae bacterium]
MDKARKKRLILAIDDEEDVLLTIKDFLHDEGFDVLTAADGAEGLELYTKHHPDLILVDLMMPKMGGFEFMQRLNFHPAFKKTPTIMLTAHGQTDNIFAAQNCRATDFLIKPFNFSDLLDVIYRNT